MTPYSVSATHEKGSIGVDKGAVRFRLANTLKLRVMTEYRVKEQRLRPVGVVARQRIWHAHAAFIGALAQGLLDERGRAAKEAAELVAARELPRLQLREQPHQQLSRERLQHCD